jgi:hypothetical protein
MLMLMLMLILMHYNELIGGDGKCINAGGYREEL